MTKREMGLLASYQRSKKRYLSDCYKSFSNAKARAFDYCKRKELKMGGFNGRICSFNTFSFTYAFEYVNENGVVCLHYITPNYDYDFEYSFEC